MPATLDQLEAKKRETFAALRAEENEHVAVDAMFAHLEEQVNLLYRWTIQQTKGDITVREVFDLWGKMVSVCDFFIDYIRDMAGGAPRSASFDGLLDLRLACDEKREFYRGNW